VAATWIVGDATVSPAQLGWERGHDGSRHDGRDQGTRHWSVVLAAVVMGAVLSWQRQATGAIQAPVLTHLTWSTLMVWLLPPLFYDDTATMRAVTGEHRPR
jgi:membrane protease YdiL (CAAX protease family)